MRDTVEARPILVGDRVRLRPPRDGDAALDEEDLRNERIVRDGRVRDARYYSVISQEWPEAKRRLESLLAR